MPAFAGQGSWFMNKTRFFIGSAFVAALAAAAPAAAQQSSAAPAAAAAGTPQIVLMPIGFGQSVEGSIGSASTTCTPDNPRVKSYSFTVPAGTRVEAVMTADDFDTVLEIGRMDGCSFQSLGRNDDGAGPDDGLNSRLTARLRTAGTYILQAQSLQETGNGKYTLRLNRLPSQTTAAQAPAAITIGRRITATLGASDPTIDQTADEDSVIESARPYKMFALTGVAGAEYLIKVDSDAFDPTVDVGIQSPLGFSVSSSNDDGGGEDDGLNSRLRVKFESSGTVMVRVSPLSNDSGEFTLTVENAPPADAPTATKASGDSHE